jgi:hypothetical protein
VHCLFSTPKFYRQEQAVAIAAAGDWWSYRLYKRSDEPFQQEFRGIRHRPDPEEIELVELVVPSNIARMKAILQEEETEEDRKIRSRRKRDERAARRSAMRDQRNQAFADWSRFVDVTEDYTDDNINEAIRLRAPFDTYFHTQRAPYVQPHSSKAKLPDVHDKWSGVMKLGTETSSVHLECIREYLEKEASASWNESVKPFSNSF